MENNQELENLCMAKRVRLVVTALVHAIDNHDGHGVDARDGNRDANIEELVEQRWRDVERLLPRRLGDMGRRNGDREFARRKFQQRCRRQTEANSLRAISTGHIEVVHGDSEVR